MKEKINFREISPNALVSVFEKHNIKIPRKLRISCLRSILRANYIKEFKELEKHILSDEKNIPIQVYSRYHRLKNFEKISEFQLENDFKFYKDKKLDEAYIELLWDTILKDLNNEEILHEIKMLHKEPLASKLSVLEYNRLFDRFFECESDSFDGVKFDEAVELFESSSNKKELFDLGQKYNVIIPKYYTKKDLVAKLRSTLSAAGQLDEVTEKKIKTASVKEIKDMLEQLNIDSKSHITKGVIVKMIMDDIKNRRLSTKEVVKMKEAKEDQSVTMPTKEVIKDIVKSEKDYSNYFEELIKNQQLIIELLNQNTTNDSATSLSKDIMHKKGVHSPLERIYNVIVIILIILVSSVWIAYGITTLF